MKILSIFLLSGLVSCGIQSKKSSVDTYSADTYPFQEYSLQFSHKPGSEVEVGSIIKIKSVKKKLIEMKAETNDLFEVMKYPAPNIVEIKAVSKGFGQIAIRSRAGIHNEYKPINYLVVEKKD